MTEREIDLLMVIYHLLYIMRGENVKYNIEWAKHHTQRAMHGMPEDVAEHLSNTLVATCKMLEKTPSSRLRRQWARFVACWKSTS